jgi:hypothetical protein
VERGRDRHHSVGDVRQQEVGQREVSKVVGADLQFEAVVGPSLRHQHDPGVVDQDIQVPGPGIGELAD